MRQMKDKNVKQLILALDQDMYDNISGRAKVKGITVLAEIRNLLTAGINVESKNDDISYLARKIDSYDDRLWKILNSIKLTYDLTVQEFVNKGYAANKKPNEDYAYQEFWKNRKIDRTND